MSDHAVTSALHRLLALLADDASADDIAHAVAEARASGVRPDEFAEIEKGAWLAMRVHRTLRQHRRREAELTALFDTASDLAALRDLDAVLRSIVRRARLLLGTDTAYLTLPDEQAGDTYMRVTDGSVSPLFQALRVPLGKGLGGLVAQTSHPYATPEYQVDERFDHTSTINTAVQDEGLVAILGVPLLLGSSTREGGKVIGVLFAADRTARAFSPDEVALLCSLAAHAAIAIDTARALADTRLAMAELADANAVIRDHAAAVQRAEEVHDRLTNLVLSGGATTDVTAALAELLNAAVAVHDPTGHQLTEATTHQPANPRHHPTDTGSHQPANPRRHPTDTGGHRPTGAPSQGPTDAGYRPIDTSNRPADPGSHHPANTGGQPTDTRRHQPPDPRSQRPTAPGGHRPTNPGSQPTDPGGSGLSPDVVAAAAAESRATARAVPLQRHWVCAILAGPELLGSLVLLDHPQLGDADRRLFERASVVTALLLLLRRTVAETENRVRGELLTELLTVPDRDPGGLVDRGRRLGTDLNLPHLLLVAQGVESTGGKLAAASLQHLFGRGGISAEHDGTAVILLPHHDTTPAEAARDAADQLARVTGDPVTVAAAGPAVGPAALAAAHAEAVRCLRAMHVLGRTGEGACAADLGFLGVVLGEDHDADGFVRSALGPLLDYDARRGTHLLSTLRTYFACGTNLARTKDELHIHVNTVVQRLERIESLLGPDWNSPDRALELQLALRLRALRCADDT